MLASTKSKEKKLVNNILDISFNAKIRKKENKNTIDATIGMFYDENGDFFKYDTVIKAEKRLSLEKKYTYGNTSGTESFKTGVLKWVLGDSLFNKVINNNSNNKYYYGLVPSCGGTGAISNTISNYLNPNEKIILPNIYWSPYQNMCYEFGYQVDNFEMTKDNKFNFDEFKELVLKHKKEQKRIFFILNDPCHNPTGYCLKESEYKKIFDLQNEIAEEGIPFIILLDIAYIDFHPEGIIKSREPLEYLLDRKDKALVILSFSASKTFSIYGLRVGASICVHKNKEVIDEFVRVNEYSSRCKWSSINQEGMNLVDEILNSSDLLNEFKIELEKATKVLLERSKIIINELNKNKIEYYPFDCGFFITIKTNNAEELYNKLLNKDIFVIPMNNGIRISISSLKMNEIGKLIEKVRLLNVN